MHHISLLCMHSKPFNQGLQSHNFTVVRIIMSWTGHSHSKFISTHYNLHCLSQVVPCNTLYYVFTPFTLDLNVNVVSGSLATPCRWCPPSTLNGTFSPLQCVWGRWSRPRQCWEKAISPRWITSLSETGENSTLLGTDVHNSGLWPPPVYSSSTSPVVWFRSNSPSKLVGPPVQDLFPTLSVELPVQGGFASARAWIDSWEFKTHCHSKNKDLATCGFLKRFHTHTN